MSNTSEHRTYKRPARGAPKASKHVKKCARTAANPVASGGEYDYDSSEEEDSPTRSHAESAQGRNLRRRIPPPPWVETDADAKPLPAIPAQSQPPLAPSSYEPLRQVPHFPTPAPQSRVQQERSESGAWRIGYLPQERGGRTDSNGHAPPTAPSHSRSGAGHGQQSQANYPYAEYPSGGQQSQTNYPYAEYPSGGQQSQTNYPYAEYPSGGQQSQTNYPNA
ncbi:hypothetical protein PLICRDRAFT_180685, partial [Plicaturopsis crispa FD-325 SS-3]